MKFKHKIILVIIALIMAITGLICIVWGTVYGYISGNLIIQVIGVILFIVGM